MSDRAQDGVSVPSGLDPSKGGRARAEKLTPEERQEIARRAAAARWGAEPPRAEYGSEDHPLCISGIEIPCYVLNDGRRVLVTTSMIRGLDMSLGTAGGGEGDRLGRFIAGKAVSPFISKDLLERINTPIKFINTRGAVVHGYEATVLADLCEAVLAARRAGQLRKSQMHIADRCEILVRGFARVGIIALVDEATGYQQFRARKALEEILEEFISKELLKWVKVLPDDFYREMFRLQNWSYRHVSSRRPIQAGRLTNDLVYERLAPGVLEELKRITPRDDKGRLRHKYHQRLTENVGHPRLREHLTAVIALMRAADDWRSFYKAIQRALPKQIQAPLFDWAEKEHGGGEQPPTEGDSSQE